MSSTIRTRTVVVAALALLAGGCDGCANESDSGDSEGVQSEAVPAEESDADEGAETAGAGAARSPTATADRGRDAGEAREATSDVRADGAGDEHAALGYDPEKLWPAQVSEGRLRIEVGRTRPIREGADVDFEGDSDREPGERQRYPEDADREYRADVMSEPFRGVERVDVLTTKGPVEVALGQVSLRHFGQKYTPHYRIFTEPMEAIDNVPGTTLVAPAGVMADDAGFLAAGGSLDSDRLANTREDLWAMLSPAVQTLIETGKNEDLPAEGDDDVSSYIGVRDTGLDDRDFSPTDGRFPAPHSQFVAVGGPRSIDAIGQEFPLVRAALLVDESGEVSERLDLSLGQRIFDGHVENAGIELLAIADPNGDGVDGLLYRLDDSYRWVDFDGDTVVKQSHAR